MRLFFSSTWRDNTATGSTQESTHVEKAMCGALQVNMQRFGKFCCVTQRHEMPVLLHLQAILIYYKTAVLSVTPPENAQVMHYTFGVDLPPVEPSNPSRRDTSGTPSSGTPEGPRGVVSSKKWQGVNPTNVCSVEEENPQLIVREKLQY